MIKKEYFYGPILAGFIVGMVHGCMPKKVIDVIDNTSGEVYYLVGNKVTQINNFPNIGEYGLSYDTCKKIGDKVVLISLRSERNVPGDNFFEYSSGEVEKIYKYPDCDN